MKSWNKITFDRLSVIVACYCEENDVMLP